MRRIVVALGAAMVCASVSRAALERHEFAGVSTSGYGVGQAFTGYFEVQTTDLALLWNPGIGSPSYWSGWFGIDIADVHFSAPLEYGYEGWAQDGAVSTWGGGDSLWVKGFTPAMADQFPYPSLSLGGGPGLIVTPTDGEGLPAGVPVFDAAEFTGGSISFFMFAMDPVEFSGTITSLDGYPVPEPGSAAVVMLAGAGMLMRRRR